MLTWSRSSRTLITGVRSASAARLPGCVSRTARQARIPRIIPIGRSFVNRCGARGEGVGLDISARRRYDERMLNSFELDLAAARDAVRRALAEDVGTGDITTEALVPADAQAEGIFLAREGGVLAGVALISLVFHELDRRVDVQVEVPDGERFPARA